MVERALRAAGYRTGLYTSPHLDRLEERIALDGEPVASGRCSTARRHACSAAVDAAMADGRLAVTPTFFEVTTAIAFEVFRSAAVEVGVIEVGLGGRFDATNVISAGRRRDRLDRVRSRAAPRVHARRDRRREGWHRQARRPARRRAAAARGDGGDPANRERGRRAAGPGRRRGHARNDGARPGARPSTQRAVARPADPCRMSLLGRHQVSNAATAVRLLEVLDARGLTLDRRRRGPGRDGRTLAGASRMAADGRGRPAHRCGAQPGRCGGARVLPAGRRRAAAAGGAGRHAGQGRGRNGAAARAGRLALRRHGRRDAARLSSGRARLADRGSGARRPRHARCPSHVRPSPPRSRTAARAVAAGSIYFVGPLRARLLESGAVPI